METIKTKKIKLESITFKRIEVEKFVYGNAVTVSEKLLPDTYSIGITDLPQEIVDKLTDIILGE